MAKDFDVNIRCYGGISHGYTALVEVDFTAAAGPAYVPPERGNARRIVPSRTIQLLQDATGTVETFQLSLSYLRLPANILGSDNDGNDAGDGRNFWIKNSGSSNLQLQTYTGANLLLMPANTMIVAQSNDNNNWDFYFKAENVWHYYDFLRAVNAGRAIQELADLDTGKGFTEITYTGVVFASIITAYTDATKTKILEKTTLSYTGAFVTGIVKDYYDFETGTVVVVRQSVVLTYNANYTLQSASVTMTRF